MADILAELEGFLGEEVIATLRANPEAVTRLKARDDIYGYYMGESDTPPADPPRREAPPVARTAPPPRSASDAPGAELSAIMAKLDAIGDVDAKIAGIVTARGNELVNNAIAISMKNSRELSRLDARSRAELGEDLDDSKLEAHAAAAAAAGRPFRTITDAYEDMTREARFQKELTTKVAEGVAAAKTQRASGDVPGVSPTAAAPFLKELKSAGRKPDGSESHLDKATAAFAALRASRENAA